MVSLRAQLSLTGMQFTF